MPAGWTKPSRNYVKQSRWMAASIMAARILGQALELTGHIPEAMAEYEKAIALNDDPIPQAFLGRLYGTIGQREEAMKIQAQLNETRQHRYIDAYSLALVSLGLGDRDQALSWLEQGFQERSKLARIHSM